MDDDSGLVLPSAERVAARATILATVTCRGFIDADGPAAGDLWNRAQQWLGGLGIEAELEDGEKALLAKPLGSLAPQEQIDACWLCEGMVVLAWALGRYEMPAYDRQIVAADVAEALGFLKPQAETVLAKPVLRPAPELEAFREGIFAVHWRLVDFRVARQQIDFAAVAANAWFGPMSLALARLIDGDLAIGQTRIDKGEEAEFRACSSIARERHRAANWLLGDHPVFSQVDTST